VKKEGGARGSAKPGGKGGKEKRGGAKGEVAFLIREKKKKTQTREGRERDKKT